MCPQCLESFDIWRKQILTKIFFFDWRLAMSSLVIRVIVGPFKFHNWSLDVTPFFSSWPDKCQVGQQNPTISPKRFSSFDFYTLKQRQTSGKQPVPAHKDCFADSFLDWLILNRFTSSLVGTNSAATKVFNAAIETSICWFWT